MTTLIAIPDDLIERIKSEVSQSQTEIEKFFTEAAQKQLREVRARRLQQQERPRTHRTPREVYDAALAQVSSYETKYKMPSLQFLQDFESGALDEDPNDWMAFYRWRGLAYSLISMEKRYGFRREERNE